MDGKFQVQPSPVFLRDNPNVYCKPKSDFLGSPGDVKEVRKCVLSESEISDEAHASFHQLLNKYQAAFSTSSEDIGHTELITLIQA